MSAFGRIAAVLLVALAGVVVLHTATRASPPGEFNFQARLTDPTGKPLPDGTVAQVSFRMFSDASAADASFVWGERHTNVPISRGVISVRLGGGAAAINADYSVKAAEATER